mmetsp:Transcript_21200/g.66500  ORF Transcript_21200/g.66500 Transcript_21200/m.66500 type:complete len:271 (+) Transcript_21200:336-1148(+)
MAAVSAVCARGVAAALPSMWRCTWWMNTLPSASPSPTASAAAPSETPAPVSLEMSVAAVISTGWDKQHTWRMGASAKTRAMPASATRAKEGAAEAVSSSETTGVATAMMWRQAPPSPKSASWRASSERSTTSPSPETATCESARLAGRARVRRKRPPWSECRAHAPSPSPESTTSRSACAATHVTGPGCWLRRREKRQSRMPCGTVQMTTAPSSAPLTMTRPSSVDATQRTVAEPWPAMPASEFSQRPTAHTERPPPTSAPHTPATTLTA